MPSGRQGSIHLFRLAGVDLYLHWSWFLVAVYEIQLRRGGYSSVMWNVLEYLALFLIVLTHEFGHAMACRSVGGTANQILLWPFGGGAYVSPPQRPGGTLWSIAAGALGNVGAVAGGGVWDPATTAGCDALEHRGGAAGERGAAADPVPRHRDEPVVGIAAD